MKKIFSIIVAILSLYMLVTTSISASAVAENTDTIEFFEFTESNTRMESNGSFEFRVKLRLTSDLFYATSDTLRIDTAAWIYNQAMDEYGADPDEVRYADSNITFTVTLYDAGFFGGEVASYVGRCDEIYGGRTFSVEEGHRYYIEIVPNCDFYGTPRFVEGYGRVSPISLNEP